MSELSLILLNAIRSKNAHLLEGIQRDEHGTNVRLKKLLVSAMAQDYII